MVQVKHGECQPPGARSFMTIAASPITYQRVDVQQEIVLHPGRVPPSISKHDRALGKTPSILGHFTRPGGYVDDSLSLMSLAPAGDKGPPVFSLVSPAADA